MSVSVSVTITDRTDDRNRTARLLRQVADHIEEYGFLSNTITDYTGTPGQWRNVGEVTCYPSTRVERATRDVVEGED